MKVRDPSRRRSGPVGIARPEAGSGFAALGVGPAIVAELTEQGMSEPFPIQEATIPDALAGRDILGQGRTGSGKTLSFAVPAVQNLAGGRSRPRSPRALVLSPTRELASQIAAVIRPLAAAEGLNVAVVFGGVGHAPQRKALQRCDVLVACPGRLLDLHGEGSVDLSDVVVTVVDEADMMADHGFLPQIRRILDLTPDGGQRMLFSATLAAGVSGIVDRYLTSPVSHTVADGPPPTVEHRIRIIPSEPGRVEAVVAMIDPGPAVVFCRTKHRARALTRKLVARGVRAVELHGNLSQGARERNLAAFAGGRADVLVATDIAARGIHVDDVSIVIHADPPVEHTAYLHRSGRTARAGASGVVVTVATAEQERDVRRMLTKAGVKVP